MLRTSRGERLCTTPVSVHPIIQLWKEFCSSSSGNLSLIDCFNWPSASGGHTQVVQLLCELKSPVNLKDAVRVPLQPPAFLRMCERARGTRRRGVSVAGSAVPVLPSPSCGL